MNRKVLFISHDAFPAGAQRVLLDFLKWFKSNTDVPFEIVVQGGGALLEEFQSTGPVSVLDVEKQGSRGIRTPRDLMKRAGCGLRDYRASRTVSRLKNENLGLIFSNTIMNGNLLAQLAGVGCPVITHVHELDSFTWGDRALAAFEACIRNSTHFIAVSNAVRTNLINNHHIKPWSISVVHEFITLERVQAAASQGSRTQLRKQHGVPEHGIVIGACGTADWRKGPDLFVQLAMHVHNELVDGNVYFWWIGGHHDPIRQNQLEYDLKRTGLNHYVKFLGHQLNACQYINAIDIFSLVSREDPYPLVCQEAALLKKPILCFDGAGGAPELVEDDCGFVVPYMDVPAMAKRAVCLVKDSGLRESLGVRASEKIRDRHDVNLAAPKVMKIITDQMTKAN